MFRTPKSRHACVPMPDHGSMDRRSDLRRRPERGLPSRTDLRITRRLSRHGKRITIVVYPSSSRARSASQPRASSSDSQRPAERAWHRRGLPLAACRVNQPPRTWVPPLSSLDAVRGRGRTASREGRQRAELAVDPPRRVDAAGLARRRARGSRRFLKPRRLTRDGDARLSNLTCRS